MRVTRENFASIQIQNSGVYYVCIRDLRRKACYRLYTFAIAHVARKWPEKLAVEWLTIINCSLKAPRIKRMAIFMAQRDRNQYQLIWRTLLFQFHL